MFGVIEIPIWLFILYNILILWDWIGDAINFSIKLIKGMME